MAAILSPPQCVNYWTSWFIFDLCPQLSGVPSCHMYPFDRCPELSGVSPLDKCPHCYYKYRQFPNIRCTLSQNINVSRLVLQLSSPNPLKSGVKLRMKMLLEQRRQAMLQLHLSDRQSYCLLRCVLYYRLYGTCHFHTTPLSAYHNIRMCVALWMKVPWNIENSLYHVFLICSERCEWNDLVDWPV